MDNQAIDQKIADLEEQIEKIKEAYNANSDKIGKANDVLDRLRETGRTLTRKETELTRVLVKLCRDKIDNR